MTDKTASADGSPHGDSNAPRENRTRSDQRLAERRNDNTGIDFPDRRGGDRRKFARRTRNSAKSLHNLVRLLKEQDNCPYEKVYEQSMGVEVLYNGKKYFNFSSVDYYNFCQNEEVKKAACAAINKYGAGALSGRHSYGYLSILRELENQIAEFMGKESVLIFNSGYLANLSVIDSLIGAEATIFIDQQSHISLYHSCKLSQKKHFRYANNDMEHLEKFLKTHQNEPNKWIVTLGVFSSTGVLGSLKDIVRLAKKYQARIFIDDAHGVGMYGDKLRGVADHYDVLDDVDLIMCSFQMAFGNTGAFVVGKKHLLQPAHYETLPYIFTFALPPVTTASVLQALSILKQEGASLRRQLWENVTYMRSNLMDFGYDVINEEGHIISLKTGDEVKTCELTKYLLDNGIWVQSYVFPFAPKGNSIVRITCSSDHKKYIIDKVLPVFKDASRIIQ
jgi:8-amino-7-oxononanoate synthase